MRSYINEATTNFIEFYKHFSFLKCCDCGIAGWSRLASEVTMASDITIKYVTFISVHHNQELSLGSSEGRRVANTEIHQ